MHTSSSCPFPPDPISISSPAGFRWANKAEAESPDWARGYTWRRMLWASRVLMKHGSNFLVTLRIASLGILEAKNRTFSTKSQPFLPMSFSVFIFSCWGKDLKTWLSMKEQWVFTVLLWVKDTPSHGANLLSGAVPVWQSHHGYRTQVLIQPCADWREGKRKAKATMAALLQPDSSLNTVLNGLLCNCRVSDSKSTQKKNGGFLQVADLNWEKKFTCLQLHQCWVKKK